MPEQLSKYPDVTLEVLKSGGAQCGEGARQEILTACPARNFCKLPSGEICVYGLNQASSMTQITTAEWTSVARSLGLLPGSGGSVPLSWVGGAGGIGFVLGIGLAVIFIRFRRKPRY
jgi:hypothetical protein